MAPNTDDSPRGALPDSGEAVLAVPLPDDQPAASRARGAPLAHDVIDPAVWWSVAPVLVFWGTRQIADSQIAIAAGFATAVVVFYLNRRREKGILAWLAIAGLVIVSGSAIAGLILDSEKAYLANDPIGDGITVIVAIGSVLLGRPIVGYVACEVFPRGTSNLLPVDRVFVQLTLFLAAKDLLTGAARVILLDSLDTDGYIIFSRVVSWPLNAVFFYAAFRMIGAANRRARPAAARGSVARKRTP